MRSEDSAKDESFGLASKHPKIIITALIALKIGLLFFIAWNRRFVMDEFVQFGWAKYIPDQISELAATQVKAEGYAFFFYPAHLIGWSARSMLLIGRAEMALLACGTLAITYATARALGETKLRAALIVLILLSFSNFIERIFETRGDPLSVFFAAAALLVVIRGRDRVSWIVAAGLLSGLAFLSTQKAVYFNFALGVTLVSDAALNRRFVEGLRRGGLLLLGWVIPIAIYCIVLGDGDPLRVGHNLFFGPVGAVSPQIAADYGGLRRFVVQTLVRNALLYAFCFAGMALALVRLFRLDGAQRVALIFSAIVTALVFVHNQPWPYVFIMALPFMALWALWALDALADNRVVMRAAWAVLAVAIAANFVKTLSYLRVDNHDQLALIDRAEGLLAPSDVYLDGVGMLPNRAEPSTLWLDRQSILQTLKLGRKSHAHHILSTTPPKLLVWSYRIDAIQPVVGPLIRDSYVQIAPNLRLAGRRLQRGRAVTFDVPVAGGYGLYDSRGASIAGQLQIGSATSRTPVRLAKGPIIVTLRSGAVEALLLPVGNYRGRLIAGPDNKDLFQGVYD